MRWIFLLLLTGCGLIGPNTFRARGTVLNPLRKIENDPESARPPQILTIQRKEARVQVKHTIVGPQNRPMALNLLGEFCEILPEKATGGRLVFQCLLFSNYKDELTEMKHGFTLALPDGRKITGRLHMAYPVRDHSVTVTGAHLEPHLVVRDREAKTVSVYRHVEEVTNDFPLFSRAFKVVFEAQDLLRLDTKFVTLQIDGYQRRWIYRYDFTNDPETAMRWWIRQMR